MVIVEAMSARIEATSARSVAVVHFAGIFRRVGRAGRPRPCTHPLRRLEEVLPRRVSSIRLIGKEVKK